MNKQKKIIGRKVVPVFLLAMMMLFALESPVINAETNENENQDLMQINSLAEENNTQMSANLSDYVFENVGDGTDRIVRYNGTESSLVLPDKNGNTLVTQVGEVAFENNSKLTSVTIPEGYVSLGRGSFARCTNLTSVNLPNSLTSMQENVFGFTALTQITIPQKITVLPNLAFYGSKLKSIELPDSVTEIGQRAFYNCNSLSSVKLSSNLTKIGQYAFSGREIQALKGIVIPKSVTSIEEGVFMNSPVSVFLESGTQLDSDSLDKIKRPIFVGNETDLLALRAKQPSITSNTKMILNNMAIEGLPPGEVAVGSEFQLTMVADKTVSPDGELKGAQTVQWSINCDPKVAEIDVNTGILKINGIGDLDFSVTAKSMYGCDVVFSGPNYSELTDNSEGGKTISVVTPIKILSKKAVDPKPVDPKPVVPQPDPEPSTEVKSDSKIVDKTMSKSPKTGNTSGQLLWTSLALGTCGIVLMLVKKRKED